jgi:hypothetical protein
MGLIIQILGWDHWTSFILLQVLCHAGGTSTPAILQGPGPPGLFSPSDGGYHKRKKISDILSIRTILNQSFSSFLLTFMR